MKFVKELKHRIDELLGPLIDDEIERHSTTSHVATGTSDTLVGRITDQIIHSRQYVLLFHVYIKFLLYSF